MENSHLVKAHEHARNAATATYGNTLTAAGEAHVLASASFHEAAADTHDAEALRILSLLEDHHRKLATLIKDPPQSRKSENDQGKPSISQPSDSESTTFSPPTAAASEQVSRERTPRSASRRRLNPGSIASNLAEKRGIPAVSSTSRRTAPTATGVSVANALASRNESGKRPTPVRDLPEQQSKPADATATMTNPAESHAARKDKYHVKESPPPDRFNRFYSAFAPVINAISAPLAFTSLPLNPSSSNETPSSPQTKRSSSPPPTSSSSFTTKPSPAKHERRDNTQAHTIKSSTPDLTALISGPALRALRSANPTWHPFAKNESFYLVPTSGGTVSYANIVRDAHGHPVGAHAHHAAHDPTLKSINEEEGSRDAGLRGSSHEEFVDARESLVGGTGSAPPSPTTPRRPPSSSHADRRFKSQPTTHLTPASSLRAMHATNAGRKTMEELHLENETLRALIDKQARRLSMWEATSQTSYNALAQSFRARGGLGMAGMGGAKGASDPTVLVNMLSQPGGGGAGGSRGEGVLPVPQVPQIPAPHAQSEPGRSKERERERERKLDDNSKQKQQEAESRIAALESQLASLRAENERLARANEKHTVVIGRYREQWEKLKAGARRKEMERLKRVKKEAQERGQDSRTSAAGRGEQEGDGTGENENSGSGSGSGIVSGLESSGYEHGMRASGGKVGERDDKVSEEEEAGEERTREGDAAVGGTR